MADNQVLEDLDLIFNSNLFEQTLSTHFCNICSLPFTTKTAKVRHQREQHGGEKRMSKRSQLDAALNVDEVEEAVRICKPASTGN